MQRLERIGQDCSLKLCGHTYKAMAGLGLTICELIVELHQGIITVHSREG